MDGVSAAASVVALIQISEAIFKICKDYLWSVKDARQDIERLCEELVAFRDVLEDVESLGGSSESNKLPNTTRLEKMDQLLSRCMGELSTIRQKIDPGEGQRRMRRIGFRALKWPLSAKEVIASIENIRRFRELLNLAMTADIAKLSVMMEAELEKITTFREKLMIAEIVGWLSVTDPSTNHLSACQKHHPDTGTWLLESQAVARWKQERGSFLWLYGIPGCGKTILCSSIIEALNSQHSSSNQALAYYYFDFNNAQKQDVSNMMASLLVQLWTIDSANQARILELYSQCKSGQGRPPLEKIQQWLIDAISQFEDVFIVIDALDECPKNSQREKLLNIIEMLTNLSSSPIHLFVSSRKEFDIEEVLSRLSPNSIAVDGPGVNEDINIFIATQLTSDPKLKRFSTDVQNKIIEALELQPEAQGMFRWVVCQLEELKKQKTKKTLLKTLEGLPRTLTETYARMLDSIDENLREQALVALIWVAFARQPLELEEVAEAAVFDKHQLSQFDPDLRFFDPGNDIVEILGSFVTITVQNDTDISAYGSDYLSMYSQLVERPTKRLQLSHFSVKEYLVSEWIPILVDPAFSAQIDADLFIGKCCLLYVRDCVRLAHGQYEPHQANFKHLPLLRYACLYGMNHIIETPETLRNHVFDVLKDIFFSPATFRLWMQIARAELQSANQDSVVIKAKEIENTLNNLEYNIDDTPDDTSVTLELQTSRINRHDGREFEISDQPNSMIEKTDNQGDNSDVLRPSTAYHTQERRTVISDIPPISKNEKSGNLRNNSSFPQPSIVQPPDETGLQHSKYSISAGENSVNVGNNSGSLQPSIINPHDERALPLHQAVLWNLSDIVQTLLDAGSVVDKIDSKGRTPLQIALETRNEKILRILASHPNYQETNHGANLLAALEIGDPALFDILWETHPEESLTAESKHYLLHTSIRLHQWLIMSSLIKAGVDVNSRDTQGNTPLHTAVAEGSLHHVKQLLQKANINATNYFGETPLHMAVRQPHGDVVDALLQYGAEIDAQDHQKMTPLMCVVETENPDTRSHISTLIRARARADLSNNTGAKVLHLAAAQEDAENTRLLLQHPRIDVEARDNERRTPLHMAAYFVRPLNVKHLLDAGADVNAKNNDGLSPYELLESMGNRYNSRKVDNTKDIIDTKWILLGS